MAKSIEQEIQEALNNAGVQGEALSGEELGAITRMVRQNRQQPQRNLSTPLGRLTQGNIMPGVPVPSAKRQFAGLAVLSWTAGSPAVQSQLTNPQRNIVIRKLIAIEVRTGATAAAGVLSFRQVKIGSNDQNTTDVNAPLALFGPLVQENTVEFDMASPGVNVAIAVELSGGAIAGADRIDVLIGAIVETIG